jgi:prepilin-type processing-associated H-X9-DG protein
LIELLVVIAIIAILAALLLPALAAAKAKAWKTQCTTGEKQQYVGFNLYESDHNEMFPPAGMQGSGTPSQISWDSYIHRYIGGTLDNATLDGGSRGGIDIDLAPKILVCPADPKRWGWGIFQGEPLFGKRSYAMVGTMEYLQTDPYATTPAYQLSTATKLGVGIYWSTKQPSDWDAKSFRTAIIKDPSGSLLLVEQSLNNNYAANIWPCCSLGVDAVAWGGDMLCQMWSAQPMVQNGSPNANLGKYLYKAHTQRFQYLFHDGHVETLATNQTIGNTVGASLMAPKGMWTIEPND